MSGAKLAVAGVVGVFALACSGSSAPGGITGATGGAVAVTSKGGNTGTTSIGGATSSGGAYGSGGSTSTGGTVSMSGGASAIGGSSGNGGVTPTGGSSSSAGGTKAGGASNAGGTAPSGGRSANAGGRAAGGAIATGGVATGGSNATGGTPSSGGKSGVGGATTAGGVTATGGANAAGGTGIGTGPCDIYQSGNTPCIAAHSTIRALYGTFSGNLYQVKRSSDNTTKDIPVVNPGGIANSTIQDTFCTGTSCVITKVYDQSGKGNFLEYQGSGSSVGGADTAASATNESITVTGQKVYSLYIKPGNSYWRDGHTTGVPTGSAPEGMYMVTSGTHVNGGCCFDYGNSETTRKADGAGAMDAIYFGTSCWFDDTNHPNYACTGPGPWVQADLEYGLFAWNSANTWNPNQVSFSSKFVTAMLKNNGTTTMALKGANAQSGNLTTLYSGALPGGYNPMKKQGAIILGSGGDCCATNTNQSQGTFYEGAIVSGYPSDTTESSIQANVVAAGYGR